MSVVPSLILLFHGVWWFWDVGNREVMLKLLGVQVLVGVVTMEIRRRRHNQPRDAPVTNAAVWLMTLALSVSALAWTVLLTHLFVLSSGDYRDMLLAVAGAVLTCGSWFYAVMPRLALTWTFTLSIGMVIGLGLAQGPSYWALPLQVLILFYMVVLCWAVLVSSRLFVRGLMTELALEQQRQLVGLLLNDFEENASDWLWEIGPTKQLQHVSIRLAQIMGQPISAIQGRSLIDLLTDLAPPSESAPLHVLAQALAQDVPFRDVTVPVLLNGQRRWWALSAKPLRDTRGAAKGWRGVGSDITMVREHTLELTRLAGMDPLSGLANRHQFNERLAAHFAAPAQGKQCMLMLLDLDHFKNVNDSLGHVAGDALLCEVATRLKAHLAPDMLLARLGGDEFALLVEGMGDRENIQALGTRIQHGLRAPCVISDHRLQVHASIGVGLAPIDADTAAGLLKASDMALYAAKAAGRNTLRFFEPDMEAIARDRLVLLAEMREGLDRSQFVVHYQPQIDLHSGDLLGFEALVRWQHPTHGLMSPARFIPLAEDSSLIVPLGQWVLQQACRDAATWPGALRVAVNVSAMEFDRTDVIQTVDEALQLSGLSCHRLEIELTESTLLQDSASLIEVLTTLRRKGVCTALDDFGTGFSSLDYLRRFPTDRIKIDQSFVSPLGHPEDTTSIRNAEAIVRAIHGLAQALGMETIAEGVETPLQQQVLQRIGCHAGQGYLFARPMDQAQTEAYIRTRAN